ncbi:unnamed protein product [Zymoseptoria tritici ST99CH_3D7]|uniref:BZIP domain-containing protein n=1 Tax=Zymoseptoria tritici (strain ST99CH_3D7) TaxID=1276538 RepID=A0A1X7S192_ZYMT9|nr:unnamed protein product [Zymoseptoria tritici ST99CH_3D7]
MSYYLWEEAPTNEEFFSSYSISGFPLQHAVTTPAIGMQAQAQPLATGPRTYSNASMQPPSLYGHGVPDSHIDLRDQISIPRTTMFNSKSILITQQQPSTPSRSLINGMIFTPLSSPAELGALRLFRTPPVLNSYQSDKIVYPLKIKETPAFKPADTPQNSPGRPSLSHSQASYAATSPSQHSPGQRVRWPSLTDSQPVQPPLPQEHQHQSSRIPTGQAPASEAASQHPVNGDTKPSRVAIPRYSRSDSIQTRPSISRAESGDSPQSVVSPTNTVDQPVMTAPTGPMTKSVALPNRPRPGRKPIPVADAQDRRRNQNRQAQRNFRDKRQQKLEEATIELEQLKHSYQEAMRTWQQQDEVNRQKLNAALERAARAEEQLRLITERAEKLQQQAQSAQNPLLSPSSIGTFRTGVAAPTTQAREDVPPASYPHEVDFTNFGRSLANSFSSRNVASTNDDSQMDFRMDQDDKCGFCTDTSNCLCRQAEAANAEKAIQAPEPVSAPTITLPGGCEKCQADPERARACRELASATRMTMRGIDNPPRPNLGDGDPMDTSCSTMVDKFNQFGERTASIADLFGRRQMRAYPRPTGGYDLEEADAAEVLTSLHRRHRVTPNPSPPNPREAAAQF